ncbi:MAG: DNA cytosine methyltransferase [Ktedonobacteraceae bacterium]|nr:DNA cytosine methyltransferase [Ktedonobacteraceae bacterium]
MYLAPKDRVYLSLFTGPNGTGAGLQYAGWHAADCVEFDDAACDTIRANFGNDVNILNMDIRKQMVEHLSRQYYPLAVYTWPCVHYSNIGAIHGVQTGEDLYLHAVRNHALLWPEMALVENVLGMREKFPVVMEILKKYKGYYKTGFIVYGHDFTLQQKARFFMLMHRQPFRFPPIEYFPLHYDIPIPGYIPARPGRMLRDYLDGPNGDFDDQPYFEKRVNGEYQRLPVIYYADQTTPLPLQTNYKRDRSVALLYDERMKSKYRPLTVEELLRLHGFPEHIDEQGNRRPYTICGNKNARYKQVVDSVFPPVAYVLGVLINMYFDHIQDLAPPPEEGEYVEIQSVDPRRRKGNVPEAFSIPPACMPVASPEFASHKSKDAHDLAIRA